MNIAGQDFAMDTEYFMFPDPFSEIPDMQELEKLAGFPRLSGASFGDSNLDDRGLEALSKCARLSNLNLQGTAISDAGIRHLAALPALKYLRLKDNWQLTDACASALMAFPCLQEVQLQETSVTIAGIISLLQHPSLSHIVVSPRNGNEDHAQLLALSASRPDCSILVKGYGEYSGGKYHGRIF